MKAKSIILAAVLALQINVLLADNNNSSAPVTNETYSVNAMNLAPATPLEATFEEPVMLNDFADLAPVLPMEASFEDMAMETVSTLDLAPLTPVLAEFEDAVDAITTDNGTLSPVTPIEATFE
ncbi:MAG: hypothetical protein WCR01_01835 [Bacteroidota bacterium]